MAALETNFTALELEKVQSDIRVLFDRDQEFAGFVKKKNVEVVSNRSMRVPLEIRPGGNFQYFNADGGDLGRGGAQTFDKATLQPVFMAEAIEYTKLAQWSTNSDRKAVADGIRRIVAKSFDEFMRQIDSQYMQDGSGSLATITSVSTASGVDTYTCTTDGFGVRLCRLGQTVTVYDTTLATLRGSGTITSWDVENKKISVTPAISGATATDVVVVNGLSSGPSNYPALFGVKYHHNNASTGNWLGLSRSTNVEVRASRVNASSAALTLPLPRLAINKIGNRVGIRNNFNPVAWMHPCQKQAYEEIGQLVSLIHKQPKDEALDMYFDSMQMAGANVRTSFNWDKTRIDFVIQDIWGRGEILPVGFYKSDGRNIFEIRGASGGVATSEIFYIVAGFQTFVNNPAACAYIDSLAVPTGY